MIPVAVTFIRRSVRSLIHLKVNLLRSRARRTDQTLILLAIILLALVYFGYNNYYFTKNSQELKFCAVEKKHITEYCNFPMDLSGAEGQPQTEIYQGESYLKLQMVQVLIRHGDRSPAMNVEGMERRDFDCSTDPKDKVYEKLFEGYRKVIQRFNVRKMSSKASIHNVISHSHVCDIGQLTPKGYLQHFELGRYLRDAYSEFHIEGIQKENLYARSTNADRTVQSGSSFLYGFLDLDTMERGITLNVSMDTWFREDDNGVLQDCSASVSLWQQSKWTPTYRAGSATMEPLMKEMARILMQPRASLPTVSYIADCAYVHSCHGLGLPCGPNECITQEMAYKLMAYANWAFSNNYTAVAEVISHPLLTQIATRMVHKVQGHCPIKFAVYSGHDSTITPLLIALEIYGKRWIPYASRLVFELWQDSGSYVHNQYSSNEYQGWFLRVLFNGKVVTKNIKFCKGNAVKSGEFCPLKEFVSWLSKGGGFENISKRYSKMCRQ